MRNILTAIAQIRARLDEIEQLAKQLPDNQSGWFDKTYPSFKLTPKLKFWLDDNGFPDNDRIRRKLVRAASLVNDGLSIREAKEFVCRRSRRVAGEVYIGDHIDRFFELWPKG